MKFFISAIPIIMNGIIKRFLEWMTVKEKLHNTDADIPIVKERDLWWVSFGENVGSERNLVCAHTPGRQGDVYLFTSNQND